MADSTLIGILGVVITVFFGAVISLLVHYDGERRKDTKTLREEMKLEMNAGFVQVNERIDKVDQRIDKVDQRIDKVDQRIDKVDQRINSLILHLVPKPTPGIVQATPEPLATPEPPTLPEPELLTGTD